MFYVYIIKSLSDDSRIYAGRTSNLKQRIETHNSGGSVFTAPYRPWKLVSYIYFETEIQAKEFEKYLKSSSGRAFMLKRLVR